MHKEGTIKHFLLLGLLLFALAPSVSGTTAFAAEASSEQTTETTAAQTTVKKGWVGDRYYKNGAYLKGWQTIGKKTYYFNKRGHKVVGIKKISKKYYFFTSSGALLKKSKKISGISYYLNDYGRLEAYAKGTTWYYPNGKKMTAAQQLDYITFRRARKWVSKLTKPSQTKAQKLYTCFKWVQNRGYLKRRSWSYTEDWPARYANDHFLNNGGCCRSDASAIAYLARAIGYTDVYVCQDGKTEAAHAWAQIDGKCYDPLFASRSFSRFYGSTYKTSGLVLINKQRVAVGFE